MKELNYIFICIRIQNLPTIIEIIVKTLHHIKKREYLKLTAVQQL